VKEVTVLRIYAVILLILPFSVCRAQDRTVLLAAGRAGRVEVLDPITLETLGSIKVLPQTDGITSDRTGVLFLREGLAPEFRGCCALYALDLKTHEMTKLIEPAFNITVSTDEQHVLVQRGNTGVQVFSIRTLQQEPSIPRSIAPGVYGLRFSPDGRWLFGVSNFPTPTLEIFDFAQRKLVQRFSAPRDFTVLGTSIGDAYYLYSYRNGTGQLRRVKADNSALEEPVKIDFPNTAPECNRWSQDVLGTGDRFFLYERFGTKIDRRDGCTNELPGGALSIDPQTGVILAHLAPEFHFASLISSTNGKELYGIDVRDTSWTAVGLVRLNAVTGEVLARRNLNSDVWFIHLATMPEQSVPRGPVEATPNPVKSR